MVQAVAGKDRLRTQPAGVYAANMLGLSEQVPAKVVLLTDTVSAAQFSRSDADQFQANHATPDGGGWQIERLADSGFQVPWCAAHHPCPH